jgi:hypothetical protein
MILKKILLTNFTFAFPSCNCVRLHITTRYNSSYKFFGGIFFKGIIHFLIEHLRNCQISSVFQRSLISNSFRIRILLKVADP